MIKSVFASRLRLLSVTLHVREICRGPPSSRQHPSTVGAVAIGTEKLSPSQDVIQSDPDTRFTPYSYLRLSNITIFAPSPMSGPQFPPTRDQPSGSFLTTLGVINKNSKRLELSAGDSVGNRIPGRSGRRILKAVKDGNPRHASIFGLV